MKNMNKTDQLRKELAVEESDFKALSIGKKIIREERSERFEDKWLPVLQLKTTVEVSEHKFTFEMPGYGIVDFYPKANKVLIRKQNKWKKPALQWIVAKFNLADETQSTR